MTSDGDEVRWSYDERVAEEVSPGLFKFSLLRVERAGPVTLTATNDTGSLSAQTVLKILNPPEVAPAFVSQLPSEINLELGKSTPLTIEYSGISKSVIWTLNGKPIPHLFDMSSTQNENGGISQGPFKHFKEN